MTKRTLAAATAVVVVVLGFFSMFPVGQHADRTFDTRIAEPSWTQQHPTVLFDEAHYNPHSVRGSYRPFAQLLENDGYAVTRNTKPFSAATLRDISILVIVNAAGGSNPKLFGFNLEPLRKGRRDAPAFTPDEIRAIQEWVAHGGSLLLVADHYPYGSAASALAAALGVIMHRGYAEVTDAYRPREDAGAIEFSRANGLLADTPITNGRNASEHIERVLSFTGQSLDAATDGVSLLKLPADAVEYVPPPPKFQKQKAGKAQAILLEYGHGRVVVIGEAAMLTAQVEKGHRFGMNVAGSDNRQFALNVMHWLSRLL